MKLKPQNLPQDQPAEYQIRVEGRIDDLVMDWFEDMTISTQSEPGGRTISTLSGPVEDQAALHGLLSRLYTLGFMVISVTRVEATH